MVERFVSPVALPTPLEAELLCILAEECAEVAQRAMKMVRFGVWEMQAGQPLANAQRLAFEVGDLLEVLAQVAALHMLPQHEVALGRHGKRANLRRFLQHGQPAEVNPWAVPDEDTLEWLAATLWRHERPDASVFLCDAATKERYRARVRALAAAEGAAP